MFCRYIRLSQHVRDRPYNCNHYTLTVEDVNPLLQELTLDS
jgi:hypothetical protein